DGATAEAVPLVELQRPASLHHRQRQGLASSARFSKQSRQDLASNSAVLPMWRDIELAEIDRSAVDLRLKPADILTVQGDDTDLAEHELPGEGRILPVLIPAKRTIDQIVHGHEPDLPGKAVVRPPARP